MATWPKQTLCARLPRETTLPISPLREDGKTYGTPAWIWSVAVDGDLDVRAYKGQNSGCIVG